MLHHMQHLFITYNHDWPQMNARELAEWSLELAVSCELTIKLAVSCDLGKWSIEEENMYQFSVF